MIKWFLVFCIPFLAIGQEDNAFAKAETLYKNGQYHKAKPIFLNYLASHSNDLKTIEYLGDIEGNLKNWDAAIPYYKKLVSSNARNANYHYKYGGVLGMKALEVNKFSALAMVGDIKESFETAAGLDSRHIGARWALVRFYMELPSIVGGSEAKAKQYADELLQISKVDGFLAHGFIAGEADRPKDAEKYLKNALKIGGSVTCYETLATHYKKNNAPEKAQQIFMEAQLAHKSINRFNYLVGEIAGQHGVGLNDGIASLEEYISNYSATDKMTKKWAYLRLAQIHKYRLDKSAALLWVNKALSDDHNFKEALAEKSRISAI